MPQKKKLKKFEDRIRLIPRRNHGVKIETVIAELNSMFRGWIGYFAKSSMKQYLEHWKPGSNSYWKMAGIMNHLLRNEMIHNHFGLLDVAGFYKRLHTKCIESDRVVLDWRYHSLFG